MSNSNANSAADHADSRFSLWHRVEGRSHCRPSTELALRAGFRAIDTANQRRHYFEEGVGQALAAAYRAGLVRRDDLFLQTKFTYQRGQDHRCPTIPRPRFPSGRAVDGQFAGASRNRPRRQLRAARPSSNYDWTDADAEVWEAMRRERDAGRTRLLGVSNVSLATPAADGRHALNCPRSCKIAATPVSAGTAPCANSAASTRSSIRDFRF